MPYEEPPRSISGKALALGLVTLFERGEDLRVLSSR